MKKINQRIKRRTESLIVCSHTHSNTDSMPHSSNHSPPLPQPHSSIPSHPLFHPFSSSLPTTLLLLPTTPPPNNNPPNLRQYVRNDRSYCCAVNCVNISCKMREKHTGQLLIPLRRRLVFIWCIF